MPRLTRQAWRIFQARLNKTTALTEVLLDFILASDDLPCAERALVAARDQGCVDVAEAQLRTGAAKNARATLTNMTAAGHQGHLAV